jgi:hypothetical protein
MMADHIFKRCPACGFEWNSQVLFLQDPDIKMIGYQAYFEEIALGLFYFNHSCKGTMAIKTGDFKNLYDGSIFSSRATGTKLCKGHCIEHRNLKPCQAPCEASWVREVIQVITNWPKDAPAANR